MKPHVAMASVNHRSPVGASPFFRRAPSHLPGMTPPDPTAPSAAVPPAPVRASDLLAGLGDAFPGPRVTLGDLMDRLGDAGIGMVLILLSLPAFIPTPGVPAGLVFGTAIALVAVQVLAGRHVLWLPERLRAQGLPRDMVVGGAAWLAGPFRAVERLLKPRLVRFTGRGALAFLAVPIFLLAAAIFLPIPFGNQLPAIALIAFGFGLIERDGLAVLAGIVLAVAALVWNGLVVLLGAEAAAAAFEWLGGAG